MTQKLCQPSKVYQNGSVVTSYEAVDAALRRDDLVKFLYQNLVDWVVTNMNSKIMGQGDGSIGICDPRGFLNCESNQFSEMFTNYTYEKILY
ncbi:hypothetical protein ACHQM5_006106 [Ranunculus cassubicifolius]